MTATDADQLLTEIRRRKNGKKRLVFVSGNFNVIHPGHLRLLRFAAECGDFLVVGVNHDRSGPGVMVPAALRLEGLKSVSYVNYAFVMEDSPEQFIVRLRPSVVVKGSEHEGHENPERAAVESYGGKLTFGSGDIRFSSLELLRQEFDAPARSTIVKPGQFPTRHKFGFKDLAAAVRRMQGLKVCVIGDTIIDEYITCDPLGMSQEDPTIVVTPVSQEKFIGGAAIVASHARSLGAQVTFTSVVGQDATADFVRQRLGEYGVDARLFTDDSRPTTLKQRFRASGKTLLRVSHLRQHNIGRELAAQIVDSLKPAIDDADLVLFSDFNYGCLSQPLVDEISAYAAQRGKLMAADSQSSSQTGDISRFRGMGLLSPTEREARLAVRDFNSGIVVMAEALRKRCEAKSIVITLGAEGLLVHANQQEGAKDSEWLTDRLPAFNTAPKDPAGAGDSFLTCAAMGLAVGCDIWRSTYLGALAAACQVGRLGNIPLTPGELLSELEAA